MGAIKFVQTLSRQVSRFDAECREPVRGLFIAKSFAPRLYAWLLSDHRTQPHQHDHETQLMMSMYPQALWKRLNFQTQGWFNECTHMFSRVHFAKNEIIELEILFATKEESKGFSFLIKLNGDVALVADKQVLR